jgi:hypothetical protein
MLIDIVVDLYFCLSKWYINLADNQVITRSNHRW